MRMLRNVQKLDESAMMVREEKNEISLGNPAHAARSRRNNASRGTRERRVTDMRVLDLVLSSMGSAKKSMCVRFDDCRLQPRTSALSG